MLELTGGFFENFQKIDKIYRKYFQARLAKYQFTPNEITVILFLYNNAPALDTATDIARLKGISKGLVARSVESLCQKGYIEAVRDQSDRRIVHLRLTQNQNQMIDEIQKTKKELESELERNIPAADLAITKQTLSRLLSNTEGLLDRSFHHAE